jgi:3-dehydroquinate dehydratase/shikimate dehydrogenase
MLDKFPVQVCIPVCESSVEQMRRSAVRAAQSGELVELRLDCLNPIELSAVMQQIDNWLPSVGRPVILTLRPYGQGGPRSLDRAFRLDFFKKRSAADLLDIEMDLVLSPEGRETLDWQRVICSHHDFAGTPPDLDQIYAQMADSPARILKITVQANDITDCLALFHLLDRARKDGRQMIAIAMGAAGVATRILGPSHGAFLTYGPMENESATAPGQITAGELKHVYRIEKIDRETEISGLVGHPVSHSISPFIHNAAFAALNLNHVYIPFEVKDLSAFLKRMVDPRTREIGWSLRGLSVTAPYKSEVMKYLSRVETAASEIGAVNTIVVEADALIGYNTDGAALVQPLIDSVGSLKGLRCAVIGAGGAARAALWSLHQEGADITIFGRDVDKARPVAENFGAQCKQLTESSFSKFDLVINTTPLGTRGPLAAETVAVASQLRGTRLVYDLVYNPTETRFLREARQAGCEVLGGSVMLVAQACKQFELWTGQRAPFEVMKAAAENALYEKQDA